MAVDRQYSIEYAYLINDLLKWNGQLIVVVETRFMCFEEHDFFFFSKENGAKKKEVRE